MFDSVFQSAFASNQKRSSENYGFGGLLSFFNGAAPGMKTSASNYKPALKIAAFYNGVDQISNDIAKIPFNVFQDVKGNKNKITNHPAHELLSNKPNEYMTPFIWKKVMAISTIIRGNGLSIIKSNDSGVPISLEYIDWNDVENIYKNDGALLYKIKGYANPFLASEVIHWKNFSHNGLVGVSVIQYAAQQLNLTLEIQDFSATNFEGKGIRQGVVETDKAITADGAKAKIAAAVKSAFGEKDATRVAVLDEGMKWKPITITPQEAQIIEMAKFSVEDIARWLNIAPHKIKSLAQSTNNNIETQSREHAGDTIQPYVTNIEQECAAKLFTSTERANGYFVKGNMNVILRADSKTRIEYLGKSVYYGIISRNEARKLEDMNDGPEMLNEYLTPTNAFTETQIKNNIKAINDGN